MSRKAYHDTEPPFKCVGLEILELNLVFVILNVWIYARLFICLVNRVIMGQWI